MSAPSADIRVIRRDEHKLVPWRNGGGVTREIALAPDERGALGYGWRLSQATVSEPGPFSEFPHADRTLLVLSGDGLELMVAGVPHVLQRHEALAFPGDVATLGRPLGGPVEDLNIICDRRLVRHEMRVLNLDETIEGPKGSDVLFVALASAAIQGPADHVYPLAAGDTLQARGRPGLWRVTEGKIAAVILTPQLLT